MSLHKIKVKVNGKDHEAAMEPRMLLVHFIRDVLLMTGTHIGCETTSCGACTILFDGRPIKSCTMFAVMADGHELMTVEGLEKDGKLDPIQDGFYQQHGLQCGFCTPGMLTTLIEFLRDNQDPTEQEVRIAISGNLCRCTGYQGIVAAALDAAKRMRAAL